MPRFFFFHITRNLAFQPQDPRFRGSASQRLARSILRTWLPQYVRARDQTGLLGRRKSCLELADERYDRAMLGERERETQKKKDEPSHHDADALDIGDIQWPGIRLWFPSVRGLEVLPANIQFGLLAGKVIFPADRARLAPIGTLGQDLVLDHEGVLLPVSFPDHHVQALEAGQIPAIAPRGPLRSEPGSTERTDIQHPMEAHRPFRSRHVI